MKEEVFDSCQGGGEQEILGAFSPQGLAGDYFMVCQFITTGMYLQSRERRDQIGTCNRSAVVRNNLFIF